MAASLLLLTSDPETREDPFCRLNALMLEVPSLGARRLSCRFYIRVWGA